jgi:predicted phosphodiesterase
MKGADDAGCLTWAHVGDLHITREEEANYRDFLAIIDSMNANLVGQIDFCVLPGDNADAGSAAQYALIRRGLDGLNIPLHVIPGDHDRKPGDLRGFYQGLGVKRLPYGITAGGYRCLFLDVVSQGSGGPDFGLGPDQLTWLKAELRASAAAEQASVVFMHAYPADLKSDREALCQLFAEHEVAFVDMGHTHYNELANDGTTIYATTRSTGQIEEGPIGFSLVSLNGGVVSWRFKPLASPWPFVMITSPADHRLLTDVRHPAQVVAGRFTFQARVLGSSRSVACRCRINEDPWVPLHRGAAQWEAFCEAPPQQFTLTVEAADELGNTDRDTIVVAAPGYVAPHRIADGSDADAIGKWPERSLLGSRLGPNRNGRKW